MNKKNWSAPALMSHGRIEELTEQIIKDKQLGSSDDFGINGISTP